MKSGLYVNYRFKETIVTIGAVSEEFVEAARAAIRQQRSLLEEYIKSDPFFKITLEPYEVPSASPGIVHRMAKAGQAVGIGPMSSVAGTIAAFAVEAMIEAGANYAFVDNGGDIALFTDRQLVIGIYTGTSRINDLALEIQPDGAICGICTSSGTVGPSISFGNADAALVISRDVSLADASATALGNAVNDDNELEKAFSVVRNVEDIKGALIVRNNKLAVWGELPRLIRAKIRPECITQG